jgi:3-isopropylmalate/(R)-2-methylmalate dehydratase large subunit
MGMNMLQKILAKHSGLAKVETGDIVVCNVDKAVMIDLSFMDAEMDVEINRINNPDNLIVVLDHAVPAPTAEYAASHVRARKFCRKFSVKNFFDVGKHGICHQIIMENGFALPGQLLACVDSHTCASGAFNCAAMGLGPVEMIQIICTGKTWYKVEPTIKVTISGIKPPNIFGKDIFLFMADLIGSVEGRNIEFSGDGIQSLTIDDRVTIATMCAELSAGFVIFPADKTIIDTVEFITNEPFQAIDSDLDAVYEAEYTINLLEVTPYIAKPDFIPRNTLPIGKLNEKIRINQAFIGSCANGRLEDFRIAALILKDKMVSPEVRLIITPASQRIFLEACKLGYVEQLVKAGAVVTNPTCGACFGGHMGLLGPEEVCITSSTRNFKGRMGSPEAKIYMSSSATVAASALMGYIMDPTTLLIGGLNE